MKPILNIYECKRVELHKRERMGYWCFNGSVIFFQNRYIMAFRKDKHPLGRSSKIFICELNENFVQKGPAQEIRGLATEKGKGFEDPRLFVYEDRLYMTYNNNQNQWTCEIVRGSVAIGNMKYMPSHELPSFGERIKNVSPILPAAHIWGVEKDHWIDSFEGIVKNDGISVDYGEIRGGAAAIKVGDLYYTCFHAVEKLENDRLRYHAGIYAFDSYGKIHAYTKRPLLSAGPTEITKRPYNHVEVVFPVGIFYKDGLLNISFGYQDIDIFVAQIKIEDLWQ